MVFAGDNAMLLVFDLIFFLALACLAASLFVVSAAAHTNYYGLAEDWVRGPCPASLLMWSFILCSSLTGRKFRLDFNLG